MEEFLVYLVLTWWNSGWDLFVWLVPNARSTNVVAVVFNSWVVQISFGCICNFNSFSLLRNPIFGLWSGRDSLSLLDKLVREYNHVCSLAPLADY